MLGKKDRQMHELNNSCTCVVKGTSDLFHKWGKYTCSFFIWVSLVPQMVKNLPATWETGVRSLAEDGPLEEGVATQSTTLAWRIPRTV